MRPATFCEYFHVDTFTTEPFSGRPAGVVYCVHTPDTAEMRHVASEFGALEVAFVLPPEEAHEPSRVRCFSAQGELARSECAWIAAHYVWARLVRHCPGASPALLSAGACDMQAWRSDDAIHVLERHPAPTLTAIAASGVALTLAEALGVAVDALCDSDRCPIALSGSALLLVPMRSAGSLDGLQIDRDRLAGAIAALGASECLVYAVADTAQPLRTRSRLLRLESGCRDEPISAHAHVPLAVHLYQRGLLQPGPASSCTFTGFSGDRLGRPGEVSVDVQFHDGEPVSVVTRATAVIVYRAELPL